MSTFKSCNDPSCRVNHITHIGGLGLMSIKLLKSIRGVAAGLPQLYIVRRKAIISYRVSLAFIYHTYLLGLKLSFSITCSVRNGGTNEMRKAVQTSVLYLVADVWYTVTRFIAGFNNTAMITFTLCLCGFGYSDIV